MWHVNGVGLVGLGVVHCMALAASFYATTSYDCACTQLTSHLNPAGGVRRHCGGTSTCSHLSTLLCCVTAGPVMDMEDTAEEGFVERILEVSRVTKVVKGGKLMGFRCVCVVGNGAGKVGVGCQAGREVGTAVKRALVDAKKNIIEVSPMEGGC